MSPPSHHGSRLGVIATLVKMELSRSACITFGFVVHAVPGATPKNPVSGLIARKYPSGANLAARRCRRRESKRDSPGFRARKPSSPCLFFRRRLEMPRPCRSLCRWDLPGQGSACARPSSLAHAPSSLRFAARNIFCPAARCRRSPSRTPDQSFFGEVRDESPIRDQIADRMQPGHKIFGISQPIERNFSHARHDAHAGGHIGAVGDFHSHVALRRIPGPKNVRHHIHGAPSHRAIKKRADFFFCFGGRHPDDSWGRRLLSCACR